MAKRKPTDMAAMNLRLSEKLRKMIEVEAKKNGHSLNREMVRRLEKSFVDQLHAEMVQHAILGTRLEAAQIVKNQIGIVTDSLIEIFKLLGKPELALMLERETRNG